MAMQRSLTTAVLAGAFAFGGSLAANPARAEAPIFGSGVHIGPSFNCNALRDPLPELICSVSEAFQN